MGKVEARQNQILEILNKKKKISVDELSAATGISLVTIRKDLTALEQRRLLKRERGCAVLNEDTVMTARLAENYLAKQQIARKAASWIHDGDTILIESGSSCVLLADALAKTGKSVTVITNSLFLAGYVTQQTDRPPISRMRIILTGGDYLPESECMVGPVARASLAAFHAKYFFSGTDGYTTAGGFTGDSLLKAEVIRTMAEHAETTVMLAESQKFSREGAIALFDQNKLDQNEPEYLITEQMPGADILASMQKRKVQIVLAM
ncbi:MAG: DeoR/GlpR family DNA-binding transcription regulator [Bilifractor sp.]